MLRREVKCVDCNHTWVSKVEKPRCSRCGSRNIEDSIKRLLGTDTDLWSRYKDLKRLETKLYTLLEEVYKTPTKKPFENKDIERGFEKLEKVIRAMIIDLALLREESIGKSLCYYCGGDLKYFEEKDEEFMINGFKCRKCNRKFVCGEEFPER